MWEPAYQRFHCLGGANPPLTGDCPCLSIAHDEIFVTAEVARWVECATVNTTGSAQGLDEISNQTDALFAPLWFAASGLGIKRVGVEHRGFAKSASSLVRDRLPVLAPACSGARRPSRTVAYPCCRVGLIAAMPIR
jgi:hypothetical protein